MRMIIGAVLLLGVGLAGLGVHLARGYVGQSRAALEAERAARAQAVEMVEVYVMDRPAAFGEALERGAVRTARWPADAVPEGAFVLGAEGEADPLFPAGAEPRGVLRAMEPGEPVLAAKLSGPGEALSVTARLRPGMRAFAIAVDVTSGVSGLLRPGDVVDVYWTGRSRDREVTRLVEAQVPIVAVDQDLDVERAGSSVARTVTVEATPRQVAALAQAQATGDLTLSLVGAGDVTETGLVEVDQRGLLGLAAEVEPAPEPQVVPAAAPVAAPEPAAPAETCTIRTRRGLEVAEVEIPCRA